MRAAISTVETSPEKLLERVLASPEMTGADLARVVSTPEPYPVRPRGQARYRVVAVDLGIKASTPRNLAARGCEVLVVPATSSAEDILASSPDGVFFSNGPGDPAAAGYAVDAMRGVLGAGVPVFGICLGSQILALALGLGTYKLRYGHRGLNQPVLDLATGRVYITSHNHGFAAALPGEPDKPEVPNGPEEPHVSAETQGPVTWAHVPPRARQPFETPYGPAVVEPRQPQRRRAGGPAPARAPGLERTVPPGGRSQAPTIAPPTASITSAPCSSGGGQQCRSVRLSVLIIGSGPIVIGQAAEFDYAGTQACLAVPRRGRRGRAGQLQPGHHPDRPRHGRPRLYRAADRRERGRDHPQRASRRPDRHHGRPDRAQPRHGPGAQRHAPGMWRARAGHVHLQHSAWPKTARFSPT